MTTWRDTLLLLLLFWALFATSACLALHRGWKYQLERRRQLEEDKEWHTEKIRDLTRTVLGLQAQLGNEAAQRLADGPARKFPN